MKLTCELPPYVVINSETQPESLKQVLRQKAEPFTFPLTDEDKELLKTLEAKYDAEENCTGLAAPQIGIGRQAIVFAVPDEPWLKKWRPDLSDTMPKTIWLNPQYEAVGDEKNIDYEACFSVEGVAAEVPRFKTIKYTANLMDGTLVKGIAHGFLARAIQHEVDHLNGTLYTDYVAPEDIMTIEQYRNIRRAKIEQENTNDNLLEKNLVENVE